MNTPKLSLTLIALTFGLVGCASAGPEAAPIAAAAEVDAATPLAAPTNTPRPTNTPTATSTPTPTPTRTPTPDLTATAQAQIVATAAAQTALIDAELQKYGLSTNEGHLGWMHDPLMIKVDTYMEDKIDVDYPDYSAADFVLQTDVTWEGTGGIAGCGLLLRAEPDFEKGAQYRLFLARLAFRPLWDIEYYKYGRFQSNVMGQVLDAPMLNDKSGDTNRFIVIAQGDKLTVYANGDKMGSAIDGRLERGIVAFYAWQESGENTCTFTNSWLWVLSD